MIYPTTKQPSPITSLEPKRKQGQNTPGPENPHSPKNIRMPTHHIYKNPQPQSPK
ncbi:hypothetical protein P691DRAFT_811240 [Macrolepiota fuliginosa MF-IS2]|uniref:Uncharacterized protein n=1 Tax=Macrolepiota fuliginosa MF-IS2 TaxID=1400762 RepID=A0A9P5X222_9AGAR|nr:hypothetical protein P691DRAFT_811240 [Macrolepiota fuliginosa MF-IS2]